MSMMMMAQREVRVIPRGWKHPEKGTDVLGRVRYIGLCPRSYLDDTGEDGEDALGEADCMPDIDGIAEEDTEIAAYETVSEGTPISPSFPNSPEGKFALIQWCEANAQIVGKKLSGEMWAAILLGGGGVYNLTTGRFEANS